MTLLNGSGAISRVYNVYAYADAHARRLNGDDQHTLPFCLRLLLPAIWVGMLLL